VAKVILSRRASQNITLICSFYAKIERHLASEVCEIIVAGLRQVGEKPLAGRPALDALRLRERIIRFGNRGFVALYAFDPEADEVVVSAIRHQKQSGYPEEEK
jgi:plasmid stabilization system protein ParE